MLKNLLLSNPANSGTVTNLVGNGLAIDLYYNNTKLTWIYDVIYSTKYSCYFFSTLTAIYRTDDLINGTVTLVKSFSNNLGYIALFEDKNGRIFHFVGTFFSYTDNLITWTSSGNVTSGYINNIIHYSPTLDSLLITTNINATKQIAIYRLSLSSLTYTLLSTFNFYDAYFGTSDPVVKDGYIYFTAYSRTASATYGIRFYSFSVATHAQVLESNIIQTSSTPSVAAIAKDKVVCNGTSLNNGSTAASRLKLLQLASGSTSGSVLNTVNSSSDTNVVQLIFNHGDFAYACNTNYGVIAKSPDGVNWTKFNYSAISQVGKFKICNNKIIGYTSGGLSLWTFS